MVAARLSPLPQGAAGSATGFTSGEKREAELKELPSLCWLFEAE